MNRMVMKLTSRKFWVTIAGVATGIAMCFGADVTDIQAVTGAIVSLVSAVTYVIAEAKIDIENVRGDAHENH